MNRHQANKPEKTPGYTTETELVRRYDRPVRLSDAVTSTVREAIDEWSELSTSPPLWEFIDADKLDGLFKTKANNDSSFRPSVEFNFQGCRVTVLSGPSIRVIIDRYP